MEQIVIERTFKGFVFSLELIILHLNVLNFIFDNLKLLFDAWNHVIPVVIARLLVALEVLRQLVHFLLKFIILNLRLVHGGQLLEHLLILLCQLYNLLTQHFNLALKLVCLDISYAWVFNLIYAFPILFIILILQILYLVFHRLDFVLVEVNMIG